jgi:3-phenylpropionate/cinnamic acid dioxygenase small subunit
MAKAIKVTQFARISDTQFTAAGTCDGRPFVARTIVYRGEPIFKVQEDSEGELKHLTMKDSSFDRGDRIAIARQLKLVRTGKAEVEKDVSQLTVKELRVKAQELGVQGWRDGSVRKAQLAALVQQAAS